MTRSRLRHSPVAYTLLAVPFALASVLGACGQAEEPPASAANAPQTIEIAAPTGPAVAVHVDDGKAQAAPASRRVEFRGVDIRADGDRNSVRIGAGGEGSSGISIVGSNGRRVTIGTGSGVSIAVDSDAE